jgi:hypothetical protein
VAVYPVFRREYVKRALSDKNWRCREIQPPEPGLRGFEGFGLSDTFLRLQTTDGIDEDAPGWKGGGSVRQQLPLE